MEKTKILDSGILDTTSFISKIYSGENPQNFLTEWNIENGPLEKKTEKPILFI